MSLGTKQEQFSWMHMNLLIYIHGAGYTIRQKHLFRCEDCLVGHRNSLHKLSLAIDIVLVLDGEILEDTESYEFAGIYWESLGGSWGGKWGDGGHFSLAHQGMK